MRRLAALALVPLALAGCGSDDGGGGGDEQDKRKAAQECLTDRDIATRFQGRDELLVEDPRTGPRIRFYLTGGEAEAAQFEGKAEGSEQIGSALLFVREADDDLLEDVEACLDSVV